MSLRLNNTENYGGGSGSRSESKRGFTVYRAGLQVYGVYQCASSQRVPAEPAAELSRHRDEGFVLLPIVLLLLYSSIQECSQNVFGQLDLFGYYLS